VFRWVTPRWRPPLVCLVAVLAAALVGYLTSPPSLHASATALSALAALLISSSVWAFYWLRGRLSLATSIAAISVIWAGLSALTGLLASQCPGVTSAHPMACTPREVAGQAGVGLLLPLVPALLFLPARAIWRAIRSIGKHTRAQLAPSPVTTLSSAPKGHPRGRVTPKGTRPSPNKKRS
jgi:hypothetical protein